MLRCMHFTPAPSWRFVRHHQRAHYLLHSDSQAQAQAWTHGDRDRIQLVLGHSGLAEGLGHDPVNRLGMCLHGQIRDDATCAIRYIPVFKNKAYFIRLLTINSVKRSHQINFTLMPLHAAQLPAMASRRLSKPTPRRMNLDLRCDGLPQDPPIGGHDRGSGIIAAGLYA